jgi:hypothetical protein
MGRGRPPLQPVDYFNLPCPIVITDLNKDGIAELIVNDNLGQALLPAVSVLRQGKPLFLNQLVPGN